jgi:hypothetical protein
MVYVSPPVKVAREAAGLARLLGFAAGGLFSWSLFVLSSPSSSSSSLVAVENDMSIIGWGFAFFEFRGCGIRA